MADSLSSAPWDGDAARFTPQQWRDSCLVDTSEGAPDAKSREARTIAPRWAQQPRPSLAHVGAA